MGEKIKTYKLSYESFRKIRDYHAFGGVRIKEFYVELLMTSDYACVDVITNSSRRICYVIKKGLDQ